jgi:hypothetical protein
MRSRLVTQIVAILFVPILLLGLLGGTAVLAHSHDGHATHFHFAASESDAQELALQHRRAHAEGRAPCVTVRSDHGCQSRYDDCTTMTNPAAPGDTAGVPGKPEGVLLSIPELGDWSVRSHVAAIVEHPVHVVDYVPANDHESMSLVIENPMCGLASPRGPCHMYLLTTGQRIVRTSRALLI